jgi:hypothetical protein
MDQAGKQTTIETIFLCYKKLKSWLKMTPLWKYLKGVPHVYVIFYIMYVNKSWLASSVCVWGGGRGMHQTKYIKQLTHNNLTWL